MDGSAAHQGGSGANEVADGVARQCFFEGGGTPVGFSKCGGVLQHGGVEGGEGGRLNEEEDGRMVGSQKEGGAAGVVALRHNPGEGKGVSVLEHPLDGIGVLRGDGGCAQANGVGNGEKRGVEVMGALLSATRWGVWDGL
jgi:hypothetical protein